jgi:hypothetical protein
MAFPSSSFAVSVTSDSIDPLLSDSYPFEPFEPFESQSTAPTESGTFPIPSSLKRVGVGRNQLVLWSNMTKADFIEWWLTTTFATTEESAKRVNWAQKSRSSEVWKIFDQAATVKDGKPMVICKICSAVLNHSWKNGTSGMKSHIDSGCKGKIKHKQIQLSMDRMVSRL